jgi:hypothetical protein
MRINQGVIKMKQRVDYSIFESAFRDYNRLNNFPEGLQALFEYLESYEDDTGSEIELDVVALCCDYSEDKLLNVLKEYNLDSLDDLRDHTTVIMVDSEDDENPTIIYQAF